MLRPFKAFASAFRELGAAGGFLYGADRVLQRVSPKLRLVSYALMAQPVPDKRLLPVGLTRNLRFVEITADHPGLSAMPARQEVKQARFDQGATCLGVYRKDVLIGFVWLCFNAYEEDEVRCTYVLAEPEESVFDFDLYLFPEHRMGIGFAAIWHGANEYLRGRGIRKTFSRIAIANVASRRAHARLGGVRVGWALFLKAWNFELMLATLPPYAATSVNESTRPALRLKSPSAQHPAESPNPE